MNPLVEILLATYNGEHFIKDQIHSILAQSYQNFRILIRDDGSTDKTFSILEELASLYSGKVYLLPNPRETTEPLGARGNFSALMEKSCASYVMFSDQDDIWLPHKIETSLRNMQLAEQLRGKKHPLLVHTDLKIVDDQLREISPSFFRYTAIQPQKFKSLNRLLTQNAVTGCTIFMNRALADLCTPIPSAAIMHDWWIALVAASFGTIEVLETTTLLYRQHGRNTIGAQPFNTGEMLLKKLLKPRRKCSSLLDSHDKDRLRQAQAFLECFEEQLSTSQIDILRGFLELGKSTWKNRYLILKHQFYKSGFFRNFVRLAVTGRF